MVLFKHFINILMVGCMSEEYFKAGLLRLDFWHIYMGPAWSSNYSICDIWRDSENSANHFSSPCPMQGKLWSCDHLSLCTWHSVIGWGGNRDITIPPPNLSQSNNAMCSLNKIQDILWIMEMPSKLLPVFNVQTERRSLLL